MPKVLFIHRSVGDNLIRYGHLRELIVQANQPFEFSDYNQNTDTLTDSSGVQTKPGFRFPGNDTKPEDFAAIFNDNTEAQYIPILDEAFHYDLILLKSCYPNSNIQSGKQLQQIKGYYESVANFFAKYPQKQLVIMTSPPLVPLRTKWAAATLARQLATWLSKVELPDNVRVFNLFDLLAAPEGEKQANMLRREYRRWMPFDSHPNNKASKSVAHLLVDFLMQQAE
jgi:hypothetical protein